ncbi:MAG TPA: LysM domain-containing protein [Aquihabitans sp.]|nr:LysM domain-containing protein [Aquihabitans sp.]
MAAIIEPHRHLRAAPERPALRLVAGGRGHAEVAPIGLGLGAGHLVAAVAVLLALLLGALAIGNGALAGLAPAPGGASAPAGAAADTATVEVHAGDTLWSIARRLQPTGDVRALVDELVALNGTAPLQPGATVAVPR